MRRGERRERERVTEKGKERIIAWELKAKLDEKKCRMLCQVKRRTGHYTSCDETEVINTGTRVRNRRSRRSGQIPSLEKTRNQNQNTISFSSTTAQLSISFLLLF